MAPSFSPAPDIRALPAHPGKGEIYVMSSRLIIDGSMSDTIAYYETFPVEPTVSPDSELAIRIPVEQADRLSPITLLALLTRMAALPVAERDLLIISHGSKEGLPFNLVEGTQFDAHVIVLHLLRVVGNALTEVRRINGLPADQQAAAWNKLLPGLRYFDGREMFPNLPNETPETYRSLFEHFLNVTAGLKSTTPPTRGTFSDWEVTNLGIGRQKLDRLLALGNQVRGRFDRIDFRGCNIGGKNSTLEVIRLYFGCRVVTAPDVLAGDFNMAVVLDPKFDKDFDNKVDQATRGQLFDAKGNAIQGRQPVQLDQRDQQVTMPMGSMPATRRFDGSAQRPGDEVFIRMWMTSIVDAKGNPHHTGAGWMRALSIAHAEEFVRSKIATDITRWKNKSRLILISLWLISDHGVPLVQRTPVVIDHSRGPLDQAPDPPPLPAFALPRDPEYRQHLKANAQATP